MADEQTRKEKQENEALLMKQRIDELMRKEDDARKKHEL